LPISFLGELLMSTPVTPVTQVQAPVADVQAAAPQPKAASTKANELPTDTVSISSAAKAAQQELVETHVQTVQEAAKGDMQARRLLAREDAARPVAKK
jgi:hypothetical protein